MLRVVCDTNVIVSGLTSRSGNPHAILQAWRRGEIVLLVSEATVEEVVEVLSRPFFRKKRGIGQKDIAQTKLLLETDAWMVSSELQLAAVEEDPDDDLILACALTGEAEFLVTGDHHLLKLKRFRDIRIVTPREFLSLLESPNQLKYIAGCRVSVWRASARPRRTRAERRERKVALSRSI